MNNKQCVANLNTLLEPQVAKDFNPRDCVFIKKICKSFRSHTSVSRDLESYKGQVILERV